MSRQIRDLEENLGIRLFTRSHRAVQLTVEGREYQHTIAMVLGYVASASEKRREQQGGVRICVAADQSVATLWLGPRIARFRETHPQLAMPLVVSDVDKDCLADGIDVAIIHGEGHWPGYSAELLLHEEVFSVCSPAYLGSRQRLGAPPDLVDEVLLDLDDEHWHWINWRM